MLEEYDGRVCALCEHVGVLVVEVGFALAVVAGDGFARVDDGGLDGDDIRAYE